MSSNSKKFLKCENKFEEAAEIFENREKKIVEKNTFTNYYSFGVHSATWVPHCMVGVEKKNVNRLYTRLPCLLWMDPVGEAYAPKTRTEEGRDKKTGTGFCDCMTYTFLKRVRNLPLQQTRRYVVTCCKTSLYGQFGFLLSSKGVPLFNLNLQINRISLPSRWTMKVHKITLEREKTRLAIYI